MKSKLRKEMLKKTEALSRREIDEKSDKIKQRLFSLPEFKKAKSVCFFVSFSNEVYTHDMIRESIDAGKEVCVPVAAEQEHTLILSKIESFDDIDKKNKYGIMEPSNPVEVDKQLVDIIVVPGTVFDKGRHRIGYGKGYYDSLLKGYKGLSAGICFDIQIIDMVPRDEWDEQLKIIITEKRAIEQD